jgi:hypothetical protein
MPTLLGGRSINIHPKKKGNKKEKSHMAAVQGTRTHTHTTKNHRALLNGPHTQADPDRDWKSNMLQSKA